MSIHDSWEDLPPTVMGYCSDDAAMEAGDGKVTALTMPLWRQCSGKFAKGFSDREVAVDLGLDYDMIEENSLGEPSVSLLSISSRRARLGRVTLQVPLYYRPDHPRPSQTIPDHPRPSLIKCFRHSDWLYPITIPDSVEDEKGVYNNRKGCWWEDRKMDKNV
ncbi:hypothetical protein FPQ18DRAFT_302973 [Pyronema domesticum]|nr:hypothetical protein FPQ18DRAFT_302973 [Pyronema domesticum]